VSDSISDCGLRILEKPSYAVQVARFEFSFLVLLIVLVVVLVLVVEKYKFVKHSLNSVEDRDEPENELIPQYFYHSLLKPDT
jgi:hypothetical protein